MTTENEYTAPGKMQMIMKPLLLGLLTVFFPAIFLGAIYSNAVLQHPVLAGMALCIITLLYAMLYGMYMYTPQLLGKRGLTILLILLTITMDFGITLSANIKDAASVAKQNIESTQNATGRTLHSTLESTLGDYNTALTLLKNTVASNAFAHDCIDALNKSNPTMREKQGFESLKAELKATRITVSFLQPPKVIQQAGGLYRKSDFEILITPPKNACLRDLVDNLSKPVRRKAEAAWTSAESLNNFTNKVTQLEGQKATSTISQYKTLGWSVFKETWWVTMVMVALTFTGKTLLEPRLCEGRASFHLADPEMSWVVSKLRQHCCSFSWVGKRVFLKLPTEDAAILMVLVLNGRPPFNKKVGLIEQVSGESQLQFLSSHFGELKEGIWLQLTDVLALERYLGLKITLKPRL